MVNFDKINPERPAQNSYILLQILQEFIEGDGEIKIQEDGTVDISIGDENE